MHNILTAWLFACCCLFLFLWQLFCRRHLEARAEEEHRAQHHDPEKLLYPAIDPTNTVSASMIQPDAGRVYGSIPKPRKWRGSQLSLSDRSAGWHKFLFDPKFTCSITQPRPYPPPGGKELRDNTTMMMTFLYSHDPSAWNVRHHEEKVVFGCTLLHYRCRAFIVIVLKRFLEKLLYTREV